MRVSLCLVLVRDLKVENLLVGRDGQIKLCDFGSCSTTHRAYHGSKVPLLSMLWYGTSYGTTVHGLGRDCSSPSWDINGHPDRAVIPKLLSFC